MLTSLRATKSTGRARHEAARIRGDKLDGFEAAGLAADAIVSNPRETSVNPTRRVAAPAGPLCREDERSLWPGACKRRKPWGAQTQRSLDHFSIGKDFMPREMIT